MKTCPKCNAQLEDDVVFCSECGARLEAAQPVADAAPVEKAPKAPLDPAKVKKYAMYGGIAVAALIVIIVLCSIIGAGSGPKGAIKGYMSAYKKGDAKALLNYAFPKDAQEDYISDRYDVEVSDYVAAYNDYYKTMWKGIKKEGKVKVTYKIKKVENVNKLKELKSDVKSIGISELDDFRDRMEYLEDYGSNVDKIKAAFACEFEYRVELNGKKVIKEDGILFIYKYGGKYLMAGSAIPNLDDIVSKIKYDDKLNEKYEDMLEDLEAVEDEYEDIF